MNKLRIINYAGIVSALGLASVPVFLTLAPAVNVNENSKVSALVKTDSASAATYLEPVLSVSATEAFVTIQPSGSEDVFGSAETLLNINTNNETGYTLSMNYEDSVGALKHGTISGKVIPTVATATTGEEMAANAWGYNLNEGKLKTSIYNPVPTVAKNVKVTDAAGTTANLPVNYGVKVNANIPSGAYSGKMVFTVTTNAVERNFKNIGVDLAYMQDMTSEICGAITTPAAFKSDGMMNAEVPEIKLTDRRDGIEYTVRKLADGNCWMTDNLKLTKEGIEAAGNSATLTVDNTDLPAGETFTLRETTSAIDSTQQAVGTGQGVTDSAYYNFYALAAITKKSTVVDGGNYAGQSICPKGWRSMIKNDAKRLYVDTYRLLSGVIRQSGDMTAVLEKAQMEPLSLKAHGQYYWSYSGETGQLGRIGTSVYMGMNTPSLVSTSAKFPMILVSDSYVTFGDDDAIQVMRPMRCIAR